MELLSEKIGLDRQTAEEALALSSRIRESTLVDREPANIRSIHARIEQLTSYIHRMGIAPAGEKQWLNAVLVGGYHCFEDFASRSILEIFPHEIAEEFGPHEFLWRLSVPAGSIPIFDWAYRGEAVVNADEFEVTLCGSSDSPDKRALAALLQIFSDFKFYMRRLQQRIGALPSSVDELDGVNLPLNWSVSLIGEYGGLGEYCFRQQGHIYALDRELTNKLYE